MSRQDYNRLILAKLIYIVENNPDLRFGQILFNYILNYTMSDSGQIHVDDPFYEESEKTYTRLCQKLK